MQVRYQAALRPEAAKYSRAPDSSPDAGCDTIDHLGTTKLARCRMMVRTMRPLTFIPILFAATLVAPAAHGEVYKWIDDDGDTHYSSQPPPKLEATVVPDRLSVYKEAESVIRAATARPNPVERQLEGRVIMLERQLEQERRARQQAEEADAAAAKAAYDECVAQRRVDCNQMSTYPSGYAPGVFLGGPRRVPRQAVPVPGAVAGPFTGVTAGNLAGQNPIIAVPGSPGINANTFGGPGTTAGNVVPFAPTRPAPGARR
jgi:uncharacterized protein DUF4124